MYETLILIDPDTSITSEALEAALQDAVANSQGVVTGRDSTFDVTWPSFALNLHLSRLPHVVEESEELAQYFAKGKAAQPRIAQCASRVEISGSDDPGMDYFNDFAYVVGAIENLGTVYTFDQGSTEFMNL